eukprot:Colp12_sorted_trinity150504_noHs@23974
MSLFLRANALLRYYSKFTWEYTTALHGRCPHRWQHTSKAPEPPTTCCMSGCRTCVWDTYMEDVDAYNAKMPEGEKLQAVEMDPSTKAFIEMEKRLQQKEESPT